MSSDDLLRSIATRQARDARAASSLIGRPEDDLYAMLASSIVRPSSAAGEDGFRVAPDDILRSEAAINLGKRIFLRWSRALHEFLCSPGIEDQKLREELLRVIFSKDAGGVAILAGSLVAAFGASPAVAAIVAALIMKVIVAPAADELCAAWGATLARSP